MKLRVLTFCLSSMLVLGLFSGSAPWGASAFAQASAKDTRETIPEQAAPLQGEQPETMQREGDEEYYELLRLFVNTLDQVDRNYVRNTSRRELMEAAIRGMLSKLDEHSNYIPPEDLSQFRSGVENEFGGIGIQIGVRDSKLTIISPLAGTPAYRAGLMAGDQIVRIEGQNAQGMSIDEARKLLTGELGSQVTFTVRHPHNQETETVTLTRETVRVRTVVGFRREGDDSWDFMLDPKKRVGYIRLSGFGRRTADELRKAVDDLASQDVQALLLDLRFNPGGLLAAAIEVSDLFLSSGRIVSTEGRNTEKKVWDAHAKGSYDGFPMAILVNRASASASEIVAACLQDHDRALVVGERTWGKGSVQNIIELEGGKSALKLTTASYRRPSGKDIDRRPNSTDEDSWGVEPDDGFRVKLTDLDTTRLYYHLRNREILRPNQPEPEADAGKEKRRFKDEQLDAAIAYLDSQLNKENPDSDEAAEAEASTGESGDAQARDRTHEQKEPAGAR